MRTIPAAGAFIYCSPPSCDRSTARIFMTDELMLINPDDAKDVGFYYKRP